VDLPGARADPRRASLGWHACVDVRFRRLAVPLTWAAILNALPPEGLAALFFAVAAACAFALAVAIKSASVIKACSKSRVWDHVTSARRTRHARLARGHTSDQRGHVAVRTRQTAQRPLSRSSTSTSPPARSWLRSGRTGRIWCRSHKAPHWFPPRSQIRRSCRRHANPCPYSLPAAHCSPGEIGSRCATTASGKLSLNRSKLHLARLKKACSCARRCTRG
jgi:hypothetical protein